MPSISVIIPVYGVEKYIERCARSLFEQTFADIEYVFVNDATQDSSMEILSRVKADYPERNISILNHSVNCGVAKARETGLTAAKGKYITFCDSDDWVENDYYESLYRTAIESNADITCCGYRMTDGTDFWNENFYDDSAWYCSSEVFRSTIALKSSPYLWNKLFKKELFDGSIVHPTRFYADDWVLMVQLAYKAQTTAYTDKTFYNYYFNPFNAHRMQSKEICIKRCYDQEENIRIVCDWLKTKNLTDDYKSEIIRIKTRPKTQLGYCLNDRECRCLWKRTFREINFSMLFNKYVTNDLKLIHLAILTGLYAPIHKLKSILK